jgi:hypothetical protein
MLVEFRVKNFRSLRDEQVLSFVASKDKTLQDTHTQATGLSAAPTLVRSAVIYGANASGKSNSHQGAAVHARRGDRVGDGDPAWSGLCNSALST